MYDRGTFSTSDVNNYHKTKAFKEFVKENSHRLRIMYLPTGCPELRAIEECWHQLKIRPFMYEYHEHISGRTKVAMKYLRTAAFSQNIGQYLFRKPIAKTFWRHSGLEKLRFGQRLPPNNINEPRHFI